ncbi:hypothetical protein, conserved [Leishmania lindenbergi]|uniref:Flagellum transition zone component n=1 Tax=Leishmania lindenbergi TaxID=651832 RepID=A0AAW3AHB2_9TRYP
MTHSTYNKHDIPRELQRLIDRTDHGIEQLYQLTGRGAAASTVEIDGRPRAARVVERGQKRRQRCHNRGSQDSLQDERHAEVRRNKPHRSIRRSYSDGRSGVSADLQPRSTVQSSSRRMRDSYNDGSAPNDWRRLRAPVTEHTRQIEHNEYGTSDDDHFDSDKGDALPDVTASDDNTEVYERDEAGEDNDNYEDEGANREPLSVSRHHGQWRASRALRQATIATVGSPSLQAQPPHRRSLPLVSTPHRTLNFSNGTAQSSPASLAKPPRHLRRPDLHAPSSHLPGFSSPPPWRQRQERQDCRDLPPAGAASYTPSPASFSALYGSSVASSPSPTAKTTEATAYRAHMAAQQSTQRPTASSAVRRRRSPSQQLSGTPVSDPATPLFMSPGSAQSRSRDESCLHTRSGLRKTRDTAPAGMLSQFGRRWKNIFKELLIDPPPPAPSWAMSSPPQRATAAATGASHPRNMPVSSSFSSSSCTTVSMGEGRAHEEGAAERGSLPQLRELIPHPKRVHAPPSCTAADLVTVAPAVLPHSATSATAFADARVAEQLRAELQAREEAMLQLRMDHAQALAELRQSLTHERASAAKQTADELATSFSIKEQLLQSSLQTERERLMEAEEQLRLARREAAQRKMDHEDSAHALEVLQGKYAALASSQSEHAAQVVQWRALAEKAAAEVAEHESLVKVWKAREVDWQAREAQLQQLARTAEERREQQEASAQTALAQVEAEFTQTSQSYQDLLAEATKRMSYLEKNHRKYKLLKEAHTVLKGEYEQLVNSSMHRAQQLEAERASLHAEAQELRQQLLQRDSATQQEATSHQEMLSDYKRRLELQEASAAEQVKTLQQHIDTANHTIELLRSQMESLKQDVLEEQAQHQQTQMKAAQTELQWKERQHEHQRSAAAYKVRSEDTIAQLKRQLREKDTKMQALAASAAEPLQRLRQQLDDERGRRARLEEQFRAYKKKAKEAEEQAVSEMRREQLRTALLTPITSTGSPHLRFAHSATATPSPSSSSVPCSSGANAISGVGKVGLESAARLDEPAHPAVLVSARVARDVQREGRLTHPASLRGATAPASSVLAKAHVAHSREGDAADRRRATAGHSQVTPLTGATRFTSEESGRLARLAPSAAAPSPSSRRTTQVCGEDEGERHDAQVRRTSSPGTAVAATDVSAISPSATVESLSGISRTSPCTSTLMAGEDDAVGVVGTVKSSSAQVVESTPSLQPHPANSTLHTNTAAARVPAAVDDAMATCVYTDPGVQAHEYRMSSFHTSASEVLRRISGSREEFLAQCAAIVKSTAAAGRRSAQTRRRLAAEDGRTAVSGSHASVSETSQSDEGTDDEECL